MKNTLLGKELLRKLTDPPIRSLADLEKKIHLGKGTYGKVTLYENKKNNKPYAVKEFAISGQYSCDSFKNEVRLTLV